jgi:hypothetical protein
MAKRMMVDFGQRGFPQFVSEEEEGMAKPCAIGVEWVNPTTLQTIAKRRTQRTGPKGQPLAHVRWPDWRVRREPSKRSDGDQ